jgi:long-chain fatty acid transport protein
MKHRTIVCSVASALGLTASAFDVHAAAFALYEHGVSGLGNAYAGAAAVAEDATTVWWNPAGMARLARGKHFAIGGSLIVPSTKFSDRASQPAAFQTTLGGTGGDAGNAALVPSLFYVTDLGPRWHLGLGISVPFGLKTEYDSSWLGRFQGVSSELKTLNINPSVSYKFSEVASVGFGISYQRGEIDLLSAVNYSAAAGGALGPDLEGQNSTNIDGDAWGFNIGALFSVTPATRIGVHYRSMLDYEFDGNTSFSNVPAALAANPNFATANVKLDVETPDSLAFSVAHRLNDRWDLLADLTWWQWSRIERLPLVRTSGALSGSTLDTLTFNFDDTFRASIGVNYKLNGAWTIKLGAAYDQTPVPNAESRTVRLPDSDRYWLSAGAKYQVSRSGALDFGYTYVQARDADINNNQAATGAGVVNGSYNAHVHVLGVQYQHSF